jgi:class 3 adenylate cyclase
MAHGPIRYARNGDVSIAYAVTGDGPVDILFVGGFVSHLEIGRELPLAARFFERLESFARVISFDKRGMGLSDRDAGAYTLENIVDDALSVLDAAEAREVVAFGISEGGPATTALAAAHPDRIKAMVQFGTYARLSRAPDNPAGYPVEVLQRTWTRMLDAWGDPSTLELWAPSIADDPEAREWWGRLLRSGASPGAMRSIGHMYEEIDVRPLLPSISVPTLVLYRTGDQMVPAALSRAVAEGIPGSHQAELPGDDHLFVAGDQDAMLDEVEEFVTGRPASPPPERVLATVVFTDIVRSTEHAAELGDRQWRELLGRHERLARREVERFRGRLVKSTGDGALATFDGPARAVRAALEMRADARTLGLELRAGVHIGEYERMGDDVAGMAVHLAARVEGAAEPGQVLVSGTVKDIVVGSGLEFEDRGRHELKGVPGEWPLYEVTHDSESPRPERAGTTAGTRPSSPARYPPMP